MWQRSVKVDDKFSPQKFIHTFTIYDMHSADSPNKNHMHVSKRHCNAMRILASPWLSSYQKSVMQRQVINSIRLPFKISYKMEMNYRYFMTTRHLTARKKMSEILYETRINSMTTEFSIENSSSTHSSL